jgi:HD superfamily phosphodiesterase
MGDVNLARDEGHLLTLASGNRPPDELVAEPTERAAAETGREPPSRIPDGRLSAAERLTGLRSMLVHRMAEFAAMRHAYWTERSEADALRDEDENISSELRRLAEQVLPQLRATLAELGRVLEALSLRLD